MVNAKIEEGVVCQLCKARMGNEKDYEVEELVRIDLGHAFHRMRGGVFALCSAPRRQAS